MAHLCNHEIYWNYDILDRVFPSRLNTQAIKILDRFSLSIYWICKPTNVMRIPRPDSVNRHSVGDMPSNVWYGFIPRHTHTLTVRMSEAITISKTFRTTFFAMYRIHSNRRSKWVKLVVLVSKMHRSMMNCPNICKYSVLWWWIWGQILSPSLCTKFKFCSCSVHYY